MLSFSHVALAAATLFATATPPAATPPETWMVEASHTTVGFSVRHFFTPVEGHFSDFDVQFSWDRANPAASSVSAVIKVASVDTDDQKRDNHLRTADFFNASANPQITFKSTSVRAAGTNKAIATGDLTIKGITKRVEMPVTLLGVKDIPEEMRGMLGGAKQVASFQAELEIDRRDFQVGTGGWAETAVVGADVTITIQLEAVQK